MMPKAVPGVRVGSVAFGKGVFARAAIKRGATIGVVAGKVIDDPDYASTYCIDLGGSLSLEPGAPFRYLNHSCTPNARLVLVETAPAGHLPRPPEVQVEALRKIVAGEELTIDYAWSADGAIPCLCGSARCRGWVVDASELSRLQKKPR